MVRKTHKKAPPKPRRTSDPSVQYIRDTCATLEGAPDREAVQLLIGGVLFTEPGDCLHDAVARLWETDTYRRKSAALTRVPSGSRGRPNKRNSCRTWRTSN